MEIFGKRLKELRTLKGLTQVRLASLVGISHKTISVYEAGISEPPLRTLINIAKVLNVSTDYLLGLVDSNDFMNKVEKGLFESASKQVENLISANVDELSRLEALFKLINYTIAVNK